MRPRSILDNLSFAVTVGIATYLTASRFDKNVPPRGADNDGTPQLRPAETRDSKEKSVTSWLLLLAQTFLSIRNDRILSVAAGVTFYGLLALFPTIAGVLSLYGLIADSQHLTELLTAVGGALPTAGVEFLRRRIERIGSNQEATLSFALFVSVALALWSANRGMKALFEGLNVAYGEIEKRKFLQLNIISMAFTIGLLFFLIVAIYCVATIPFISDFRSPDAKIFLLLWIGRWPVIFIILVISLELLYRYGPSRTRHQSTWISPGALLASLVWLVGSILFSTFLARFEDYNRTFGTLAAVDILLVWMWLSSISILIGAEFNGIGGREA
ncbi:membrane protein [Rhizobium sp. BK650]|uniref:YihY/virulence factor BrkB family protein n=1 Tax=Rhizobium sp. BK650 TaxID=2586990 RepID=UPI0016113248|nr:YihY/virulence factor BrkB family protein [Rhizobium sp. BK650]MBB3660565.1 membrane protein [Rhizobium sp. BK650]